MLALTGGALGVLVAYWGKSLFGVSTLVSRDLDLRIDGGVIGVTLLISVGTSLLFGLVPALRATRSVRRDAVGLLESRGGPMLRLNQSLLVMQVAVSVVLLVGAGLFVRTLGKWHEVETGFDPRNVLVFQVNSEPLGYHDAHVAALMDRLDDRIRTIPGVVRATRSGPFWENRWPGRIVVDGRMMDDSHTRRLSPRWLPVRHDFFETLGLPVVAGRSFLSSEDDSRATVAIVDETLAHQLFGNAAALGRRIGFREGGPEVEIVGVVRQMWIAGTRPEEIRPTIYFPLAMRPADFDPKTTQRRAAYRNAFHMSVEIRTASDPLSILPAVRSALAEIDPNLPVLDPKTVSQGIEEKLRPTRVVSLIWFMFGAVVLALTALGLYGVLASNVARRTREIGIRAALGARRIEIVRLITRQSSLLVVVGMVVGFAASMAVNQLIRSFIFGVTFYDPLTIAAVVVTIGVVTSLAAVVPARRAACVDPSIALREDTT